MGEVISAAPSKGADHPCLGLVQEDLMAEVETDLLGKRVVVSRVVGGGRVVDYEIRRAPVYTGVVRGVSDKFEFLLEVVQDVRLMDPRDKIPPGSLIVARISDGITTISVDPEQRHG